MIKFEQVKDLVSERISEWMSEFLKMGVDVSL